MEKRVKFELVLRAKDTTVHDEKTGFKILEEAEFPIEADWNFEKPNLPPEAVLAMTQRDTMTHMAKNFIDAARGAPLDAMFTGLLLKVTDQLRSAPRPTTR